MPVQKKSGILLNAPHTHTHTHTHIYIYIYIYISKLATVVEGDLKVPFSLITPSRCSGGTNPFPGLFHFTQDSYQIMLRVKQSSIKYHFLVFGMTRPGIENPVSWAISEYSTQLLKDTSSK